MITHGTCRRRMARAARSVVIDRFPRHALAVNPGIRTVWQYCILRILELYHRYWISDTYLHPSAHGHKHIAILPALHWVHVSKHVFVHPRAAIAPALQGYQV